MIALMPADLKNDWPKVLDLLEKGENISIRNEQNDEDVAVIIPVNRHQRKNVRPLGLLKGKAGYKIKDNFKMTDEELLAA